jgi:hypothetical protein
MNHDLLANLTLTDSHHRLITACSLHFIAFSVSKNNNRSESRRRHQQEICLQGHSSTRPISEISILATRIAVAGEIWYSMARNV